VKRELAGLRLTRRGRIVVDVAYALLCLPFVLVSIALWGVILGAVIGR
jgi:hypothetical protein